MAEEQEENKVPEDVAEKDDTYSESKPKQKLIRVLTVLAYILSVSMAAILLSIYYVFMWDGQPTLARRTDPTMQHRIAFPDYGYHDIDQEKRNISRINYVKDQYENILSENRLQHIKNSTVQKFANSSILEVFIETDENDQNATDSESEVSVLDNSEKNMDSPTDVYDIYTSPIITSTEDTLTDINDDREESPSLNKMDIKNKLFYRRYFYKKLIMS